MFKHMKHPKGYTHIVLVIVLALIAGLMVGAAWYFEQNKEEEQPITSTSNVNANTNTVNQTTNLNTNANTNSDSTAVDTSTEDSSDVTIATNTSDGANLNFNIENLDTPTPNIDNWFSVAFKGSEALIGGRNRTLLKYDEETFTDISSLINSPQSFSIPRVDYIAANDEYWFVFVYDGGGYEYLYKYDGNTISEVPLPVPDENRSHPVRSAVWMGDKWLMSIDNDLFTYDGQVFTKLDRLNDSDDFLNSVHMAWGENKVAIVVSETNENSKVYFFENGELNEYGAMQGLITDVTFNNGQWLFSGTDWLDGEPVYWVYVLSGNNLTDYSSIFNEAISTMGTSNGITKAGWWHDYWIIGMYDAVVRASADFLTIERITTQGGRAWLASDFIDEYGLIVGQKSISKLFAE